MVSMSNGAGTAALRGCIRPCRCASEAAGRNRRDVRGLLHRLMRRVHSKVREALDIGFSGGTYSHLFYVADVEADGATMNGELHVALDTSDFLAMFPLDGAGRARLVGTVNERAAHGHNDLSWSDVGKQVLE